MKLFDFDATPAEQRILLYLSHPAHSLQRTEIAKAVGIHAGTLSRLMCRLERRGLLKIERDRPNRHGLKGYSQITVTEEAKAAA